jgi:hypothetical protein
MSFFKSFAKNPLHRWTYRFVFTVRAADPATGAPFPFFEFADRTLHVFLSRLFSFDERHPTDPFIACEWRETFPSSLRRLVAGKRFFEIRRQRMRSSSTDLFRCHIISPFYPVR